MSVHPVAERRDLNRDDRRVLDAYERSASRYDRVIGFYERTLFGRGREWACAQARGRVLELGVGTGLNLPFYPPGTDLTGVDISPAMLELARERADSLGIDVGLRRDDAQALTLPSSSFDTVVCTLSLCTIPDDRSAVAEVHRVLRPGGRFALLEHVSSDVAPVRLGQALLDPLFVHFQADHLLRE